MNTERCTPRPVKTTMSGFKIRRAHIALALWVLFLVGLTLLANSGRGRRLFAYVRTIPLGDKIGHFILYGILSFLTNTVMHASQFRLGWIRFLKGSFLLLVVIAIEEYSQRLFRWRSFDYADFLSGALGILLFGWVAKWYVAWKAAKAVKSQSG